MHSFDITPKKKMKRTMKIKMVKKRRLCSHEFVKKIYAVGNDSFLSDGSNQIKKMP